MRILIDGCDGTGKTSVCEKLANKFGCNIVRLTHDGDRNFKAYLEAMIPDNMVHDRTFLSEIIYPKNFGRASRLMDSSISALYQLIEQYLEDVAENRIPRICEKSGWEKEKVLELVAELRSEEYYVNMMRAWYFATALAKQYEAALLYLQKGRMDLWTHRKTIQKAIESNRITAEQKDYLRSLKDRVS